MDSSEHEDTELEELVVRTREQMPQLVEEVLLAVRRRIPLYQDDEAVPAAEVRRSVEDNLQALLSSLSPSGAARPPDLEAPAETGRRRARAAVPLPEVLRFYRITFAVLWDALVARARETGSAATTAVLLDAATRIWELSDEHAAAMTEAYRATTAAMLLTEQRRRGAVVEAMLNGQIGPEGDLAEAGVLLGLPPRSSLVVVAAATRGLGQESLRGVEHALAARGMASAWRLKAALQLGVVALVGASVVDLVATLEEVSVERVGVSPVYTRLGETPRALHLALNALSAQPTHGPRVGVFDPSPVAALMAAAPDEAERLATAVFGPVLALPADDREMLLGTLWAYLDESGSATAAAKLLHCHPNTVRYRLRRLQSLTGRTLSDVHDLAHVAAAAYALRNRAVDRTP